jgi:cobalt-zinc-cadmium efflux system outer membrane protein
MKNLPWPRLDALRSVVVSTLAILTLAPAQARAQEVPPPAVLPAYLSLEQSLRLLRAQGLDVLLAETQVRSAEGDVDIAGAVPNPDVSIGYGRVFTYRPSASGSCSGANNPHCDANQYEASVSDQAAIEDSLSGKRALRSKVARAALAAARLSRTDALRTLEFQVKAAYVELAEVQRALAFAEQTRATDIRTLDLFRTRLRSGAINDGDLARIETQKLEADQAVDQAADALRQARYGLAFLLGVRGPVPEFEADDRVLDFAVPPSIADGDVGRMLRAAFAHRPDLLAAGYERASAQASVDLTRRQRFPDVALSVGYTQTGYGGAGTNAPLEPPTLSVSLSAPIPVFYQLQGEVRKAQATYQAQSLLQAKATAQVVSDVYGAVSTYQSSRGQVERMENGGLLRAATTALDITRLQYDKGAATLMDLLDAQRTFIATSVEHFQDLAKYWTAVFGLEEAVGMELR